MDCKNDVLSITIPTKPKIIEKKIYAYLFTNEHYKFLKSWLWCYYSRSTCTQNMLSRFWYLENPQCGKIFFVVVMIFSYTIVGARCGLCGTKHPQLHLRHVRTGWFLGGRRRVRDRRHDCDGVLQGNPHAHWLEGCCGLSWVHLYTLYSKYTASISPGP